MARPGTHSCSLATSKQILGSDGTGEDRAEVIQIPEGVVIVVADGAGGTGGGAEAAEAVVGGVRSVANGLGTGAVDAVAFMRELDRKVRVTGGESTAVIVIVRPDGMSGASVGDSGALVVGDGAAEDLTRAQQRKPLIGSGVTVPVAFRAQPLEGTLLVATDGLLRYANRSGLVSALEHPLLQAIPDLLVSLVRLPSGGLQDDVALVVCRSCDSEP